MNTPVFGLDSNENRVVTGSIDAAQETVSIEFFGYQSAAVQIAGTWVGTLIVEGSVDNGVTWGTCWSSTVNQSPVALGIPTPASSIAANGVYEVFQTSGFTHYRIRATAWTSGTANVTWSVVTAPASFLYMAGAIVQQVATDTNNSSTTNLAAGATFTGTSQTSLGVNAFQINIKADQNCTVYVDQSMDGDNWDITDSFNYYYSLGGNSWTVQATASFYRVRVKNEGASATTYLRLQTCLCPIVDPLPRALDAKGNFKVAVNEMNDVYGWSVENTPNDEMRVVTPFRLVGALFAGAALDSNYWTSSLGTGGAATVGNAQCILSTGTGAANNATSLQTVRNSRYVGGSANRCRMVIRLPDTGTANNTRRWGAFNSTDGAFFELSGTTLKCVTRKTSSANDIAVANGSFNGTTLGATITVDTDVHTWEIYWNNSKVFFVRDGILIHTMLATTTTWADTMSLPVRFENTNSGGSTTNVSLNIRNGVIHRLGAGLTQPTYKYQSGTTAGVLCKNGAGNLHAMILSGVLNTSVVTLYDGTSTGGTVFFASGSMSAKDLFYVDFKGMPFSTGLLLVVGTANANVTLIYE